MTTITQLSQLDLNATYSYADYLTWRLEETVELIRGKIMLMAPAPNVRHQRIVTNLGGALFNYFHKQPCQLFYAPFDVSLSQAGQTTVADQEIFTVVQPDLCVVCDLEKLTEQGCRGAPDWVIEVLSPGSTKKETRIKYDLYQENGVKEYWLVYPYETSVYQLVLSKETKKFQLHAIYCQEDAIAPQLFPDLYIDLSEVFF